LPNKPSNGNVLSVALKTDLVDEALVKTISRSAISSGLQCYGDEGLVLYRADGNVVDMKGRLAPF
jgi:hypothetical protein